jgi:hypothetical protein
VSALGAKAFSLLILAAAPIVLVVVIVLDAWSGRASWRGLVRRTRRARRFLGWVDWLMTVADRPTGFRPARGNNRPRRRSRSGGRQWAVRNLERPPAGGERAPLHAVEGRGRPPRSQLKVRAKRNTPVRKPTFCKRRIRLKFLAATASTGFKTLKLRPERKFGLSTGTTKVNSSPC